MSRSKTGNYRIEWTLLAVALLALGAFIGLSSYQERVQIEARERDRLQAQAQIIDQNLGRQLDGVNHALTGVRDDLPQWDSRNIGRAASNRLKALSDAMPGVRAMGLFDANGTTLASTRQEFIGTNVAGGRAFFTVPRAHPVAEVLYVSPPFKTRVGAFSINVARVVMDSKGAFAGIVAATLDPEYFSVVLSSVLYAPDMWTALAHGDGLEILYMPAGVREAGIDLAKPASMFSRHRESGQIATVFTGTVLATGDERMIAQRTFNRADLHMDKPLIIAVSRDLSAIYAPWRKAALERGGTFGLVSLAAILGLYLAQMRRRKLDRLAADLEDQLGEGAERLELALGGADLGLWDSHLPGGTLTLDQRWCAMLGYTPEEIGSDNSEWKKRVHPDDWPATRAALVAHLKGDTPSYESEYRMRHKNGHWVWVLCRGRVMRRDAAGAPVRVVGTHMDITARKQASAQHNQLEAQLRESQKMEALGTLAGGVAHDFNNIIATIMGNAELARQDVGPAHPAMESLEEIRKASRRAKDLVQQILAFGRRQSIERKVILLGPVVEESVRLLRATLPAGVNLSVECAPDTPAALADATQVEQVLLNLCANAWQAIQGQGRPGNILVRLEARVHAPEAAADADTALASANRLPGRYACLTVGDNGAGMDKETMARIFEPFFTTKPVGKGTGLGLSVVHGIVQEHNASIEVQSVPGEGTRFHIYFPAAQAPLAAEPARTPAGAPAHGQGRHILYVDDDESIVFLMTRLLERQGYRVSGYTDPQEALAAARANPHQFDLAVTDYNMPGMSGLEVARALREIRADLPVALASGYITEELRAQAPAAGVRQLIYKPDTTDDLCAVIALLAQELPRGPPHGLPA